MNESEELVIISMQPGTDIEANFASLQAHILGIVEGYRDLVVTPDYVRQAKKDRAYLNSLSKSLNQRRIEVKSRYMAPVVAFEERVKQLDEPIRQASTAIDTQVKAYEERARIERRDMLAKHYEGCTGALGEAVPYSRIEDPAWLNLSFGLGKAQEQIDAIIERIARDYSALEELGLTHAVEAKAEFLATLDLSAAIARSKRLDEQIETARKLEEQKAAIEAARLEEQKAAEEQRTASKAEIGEKVVVPEVKTTEPVYAWELRFEATQEELDEVIAFLQARGIHGKSRKVG